MTAFNPDLAAAVAAKGIPLTADIAVLDVPLTKLQADLRRLLAKQRVDAAAERLRQLLADPNPHGKHCTPGELKEQRHWLHDADPDSTFPAIRADLTKHPQETP